METKEPTKPRGVKTSLKKDNRTILKIANSTIVIGETYEVRPKMDYTAPDGMQRAGTGAEGACPCKAKSHPQTGEKATKETATVQGATAAATA